MRPKTKLFAVKFRRILDVLCLQVLQKKFWAQFLDLCVQKWSGLLRSSDAFRKFSPFNLNKKGLGAFSRVVRTKMKLFTVEFRRILEILCLRLLQKKLWAQFHDLCVQKRSGLPWSPQTFWKFSSCNFSRGSSWRIITIYASKNEAVCCWVQTHFRSFRFAKFVKEVLGAFSRHMRPKTKLFSVKFRRILKLLCLQGLQKKVHVACVQKRGCLLLSWDGFWKFFALRGLWRKFQAYFHDSCVQKRGCFLRSSDAFWRFSACKLYKESYGCIFTIYASKNGAVCC